MHNGSLACLVVNPYQKVIARHGNFAPEEYRPSPILLGELKMSIGRGVICEPIAVSLRRSLCDVDDLVLAQAR
jgi:hypothetical protein